MSYDIELQDPVTGKTLLLDEPHQIKGETCCLGGTRECWLNITYMYAKHFYRVMHANKGIRIIYGMTGAESIPLLERAIKELDTDVVDDYWAATEGNARGALCGLLRLAQMRPDGVWAGD